MNSEKTAYATASLIPNVGPKIIQLVDFSRKPHCTLISSKISRTILSINVVIGNRTYITHTGNYIIHDSH
jgi:hypothetical protein